MGQRHPKTAWLVPDPQPLLTQPIPSSSQAKVHLQGSGRLYLRFLLFQVDPCSPFRFWTGYGRAAFSGHSVSWVHYFSRGWLWRSTSNQLGCICVDFLVLTIRPSSDRTELGLREGESRGCHPHFTVQPTKAQRKPEIHPECQGRSRALVYPQTSRLGECLPRDMSNGGRVVGDMRLQPRIWLSA